MLPRRRIQRAPDGGVALRLPASEQELLLSADAELRGLLDDDVFDDPNLRRLFPPAYDEHVADADYRRLTRDGLASGKRRAHETLAATVGRDRLSPDEAQAWLTALNDLRLLLGTRLGVTEETDFAEVGPRDPLAWEAGVYLYLTWLQDQLVDALAAGL